MLKIFKFGKNKNKGAVPRHSRSSESENIPPRQEPSYTTHEPVEVVVESEDYIETEDYVKTEENTKPFKNGENKNCENGKEKESNSHNTEQHKKGNVYYVNTRAENDVTNIFDGVGIHIGDIVNNHGSMGMEQPKSDDSEDPEEHIKKSNLIQLLMEAEIKPESKHLLCVKKHLGSNWYSIFMKLGFTEEEIKKKVRDWGGRGVKEALYQLLLEWFEDEENTLGRLAKFLWNINEREIVKELAKVYNGGVHHSKT